MDIRKFNTVTYQITNWTEINRVTVYVTNYGDGKGKIVIECFGEAWANYWNAMGVETIQQFVLDSDNEYLLRKFLKNNTRQTDFEAINDRFASRGYDLVVTNDVEVAIAQEEMEECFGRGWEIDLPRCESGEYYHLWKILNNVKAAFQREINDGLEETA